MTQTNVNVQMQIRRDTTANWQSNNTTLLDGEWGYVKDTNIFKIGNGSTQFNFLPEAVLSSNGSYSSPLFISNYHLKITSQKELRFSDDVDGATGEHYSSFKAGSQSANINYTLPTTAPTDNQYLKCSAAGVLSWDTFTGTDIADLVSNDANNRILTATGTTNSFNAEANLTFDGSTLAVTGAITSTGEITISNSAPKLTFTDTDQDNDFYIQTNANVLKFVDATSGTTRFTIDGNGFLTANGDLDVLGEFEVGQTSANAKLKVSYSTGVIGYFESTQAAANVDSIVLNSTQTNSSSNLVFQINGGTTAQGIIRLNGDNSLDFYNGATPTFKARLNSSGSLGLGTTTPGRVIHAYGASSILKLESTNNEAYLQLTTLNQANESYIGLVSGDIYMSITGTGATGNEKLRIKANGRVGINNACPSGTLSVNDANGDNVTLVLHTTASTNFIQFSDSTDANAYIGKEGSQTSFYTTGTSGSAEKQCYINSNGINLVAGKGINFSAYAQDSGNPYSNNLHDYEEGTWTPAIVQGVDNGSGGSPTYAIQNGNYVKIGRLVQVSYFIQLNTNVGTVFGTGVRLHVGGLPFTIQAVSNNHNGFGSTGYHTIVNNVGDVPIMHYGSQHNTFFECYSGSNSIAPTNNADQYGRYLIGGFTYHTNA